MRRRALVLTASDGVSAGVREDASGAASASGWRRSASRSSARVVADERAALTEVAARRRGSRTT